MKSQFKMGQTLKVVRPASEMTKAGIKVGDIVTVTATDVYPGTYDGRCGVNGLRNGELGFDDSRFEAAEVNGVDGDGKPFHLTLDDLKPLQRAKLANGQMVILSANAEGSIACTFPAQSWNPVNLVPVVSSFSGKDFGFNVVELYAPPHHPFALEFDRKGGLLWRAEDVARMAAIAAADAAIEAARKALAEAEQKRNAI